MSRPTLPDTDTLTDIPGPILMAMTEGWQRTIRERDESYEGMTPVDRADWIRQRAELVEAARAALGWKDLLLLSELEAAGEGAVRALGGPDGDFPAAPGWTIMARDLRAEWVYQSVQWVPCRVIVSSRGWVEVRSIQGGNSYSLDALGLDVRVVSVRERLTDLCEQALSASQGEPCALWETSCFQGTELRCGDLLIARWGVDGQPLEGSEPVLYPFLGQDYLFNLALLLAPQIADLNRRS